MNQRITIIAEAGVNHDGDVGRALEMIDVAAEAGADVVKFQTFVPEALASCHAAKAGYQAERTGSSQSQRDMLEALALSFDAHHDLLERCRQRGVEFLSSPFDPASARFLLDGLGLTRIKLGSGELTNGPLLLEVARSDVAMILSTGMATLDEIAAAVAVIAHGYQHVEGPPIPADPVDSNALAALAARLTLLHCTTAYPCPIDEINLRAMETLQQHFGLPVGYSDHSLGTTVAIAAAARGASMIEKHFTLDPTLPGPDQAASLDPRGLQQMIAGIRVAETCLGSSDKTPTAAERDNIAVARKGLCAAVDIAAGEPFTADNLAVKRPAAGRPPNDYWLLLGQPAARAYRAEEPIE